MISIDAVRTAVERYATARPVMKDAMRDSATNLALALADERDALVTRMETRWSWLDAHEDHVQFIDREDALLANIAAYERIEDTLREAADVLLAA